MYAMEILTQWTPWVTAIFLFWMVFAMTTKNALSGFIFKFIPFVVGIANLLIGLKVVGINLT